jgi:hypothetical protein
MATETNVKKQIYKIIESLPVERLPDLLRFLKQFLTQSETIDNRIGPDLSLDDVVEAIKRSSQNPANIQAGSGLLAEHLSHSPEMPDPSFDVATWNQQWDQIEAKMKRMEQTEQEAEADFELP